VAGSHKGVLLLVVVMALFLAGSLLLSPPWVSLTALLLPLVLFEALPTGFLDTGTRFYHGHRLSPPLGLFVLAVGALLFDRVKTGEPFRRPGPFIYPVGFLLACALMGAVNGRLSGAATSDLIYQLEPLIFLTLMPWVVVNVLRTRSSVRNFAVAAGVLAIIKGAEGLMSLASGGGGGALGESSITYLEPTANWLSLLFLLTLLVALIHRVPTASWARWGSILAFAALVLSFRRSFWIGGTLGIVLVLLLATGRRGGRVLLPSAVVFAVASVLTFAIAQGGSNNPVLARGKQLSPSAISLSADDRYRIEERRNILKNVEKRPVFGLGIAVPWTAYRAVSLDFSGARQYTHLLVLWYWMKMGVFGLIAYLWLMGTALYMGYSLWRRHPDGLHRSIGLAALAGFAGLMIAEATASFTGVDLRFSFIVGAAMGWLAAAHATMSDPAPVAAVSAERRTQSLIAGRRAVSSGVVALLTNHKRWVTPAVTAAILVSGLIALAMAISSLA
jgi:hypothetical protein